MTASLSPAILSGMDPALKQGLDVAGVTGGEATNPLWRSEVGDPEFKDALSKSLDSNGLLANGPARYRVNATLTHLDKPLIALDLSITSEVHYVVTEAAANRVVFDRNVFAEYTAKLTDALIAVERNRLANEGSIKTNIASFMEQFIQAFKPSGVGGRPTAQLGAGPTLGTLRGTPDS